MKITTREGGGPAAGNGPGPAAGNGSGPARRGIGGATRVRAAGDPTPFAEAVLDAVRRIPRGRVMSYGDVAEYVGAGGPRAVGTVLARWGSGVPWHRVVTADGRPNPAHPERAAALLRSEQVAFRRERVDMTATRWNGR